MAQKNKCKQCGKETSNKVFCGNTCKASWQRAQKPVDKGWLYQKYAVEGFSANEIAKLVHRDAKRVWEWLKDYGIETRPRGHNYASNSAFCFWEDNEFENPFQGRTHTEKSKAKMSESTKGPAPWLRGEVHHLYGVTGPDNPSWKGGATPERQAFYASQEWKGAAKVVWKRDRATCQKCGKYKGEHRNLQFDIHHIVGFADSKELRAETSNLVLLCRTCHLWVHSNENTNQLFLRGDK